MKAILVIGPLLVVTAIACGSDNAEFQEGPQAGSVGTGGGKAGTSAGGTTAGSATSTAGAGSSAGGTGSNTSGTGSVGGSEPVAGNGGAPNGASGEPGETAGQSTAGGAGAGGSAEAGAGGGGSDAPCPDLFGDYEIQDSDGTCGSLNENASQSIEGTDTACFAHFVSTTPADAQAINGGATLDADGNFAGAMLYLDETKRNPCSGTWNADDETMTVACGGQGDLCTVVLKKSN